MTVSTSAPSPEPSGSVPAEPGKPYGLIGLVVSSVAILLGAALICVVLATVAFGGAALVLGWSQTLDLFGNLDKTVLNQGSVADRINVVAGLIVYVAISTAILIAARVRGKRRWRDLVAWWPWSPFRHAGLFWILFVLTLVYSVGADRLVTYIHPDAKNWMPHPSGIGWQMAFVMLAVVLAPITEELFFRGWLYTSLRASIGVYAAIIVCALLFATAHWEATHLYALAILPVGLVLGYIRETTKSVAASMAFHALYNGVASAILLTS